MPTTWLGTLRCGKVSVRSSKADRLAKRRCSGLPVGPRIPDIQTLNCQLLLINEPRSACLFKNASGGVLVRAHQVCFSVIRSRHRPHHCCDRLSTCRPFTPLLNHCCAISAASSRDPCCSPSFASSIPGLHFSFSLLALPASHGCNPK